MRLYLALFYYAYFSLVGVYVIFMPQVLLSFGYSKTEVGIVYFAAPFMRFLLPFIFKYFVPLTERIYTYSLWGMLLSGLLFIGTVEHFWLYLFINLLFGASMGISLPFVETLALGYLSKKEYGKIRLWGSIGFILIALWLGKMLSTPYEALYYLAGMALLTLLFGGLLLRFVRLRTSEESEDGSAFSLQRFAAFWGSIFLMQVAFGGFYNFFTIYELDHGVSLEMTSWMWTFGVVCEIFMLFFQGRFLQKNLLSILKFATLITVLRWLLLYLYAESIVITFLAQSLHAVSFALYHSAMISYVFSLYKEKRLAQQFVLGIGFGLGGSLGSLLSGKIYGEYLFLVEALITLLAWVMLLLHERREV